MAKKISEIVKDEVLDSIADLVHSRLKNRVLKRVADSIGEIPVNNINGVFMVDVSDVVSKLKELKDENETEIKRTVRS